MQIFRSVDYYIPTLPTVATMGTFDGMHAGHIFVLEKLKEQAQKEQAQSLVITFFPHPRVILQPHENPAFSIYSLEEKIEAFFKFGINRLLILPFTMELSTVSSSDFIDKILYQTLKIQHFIIGYDHHFGRNRSGGFEELKQFEKMEVTQLPAILQQEKKISSTLIREWLNQGKIGEVTQALGKYYQIEGKVVHGKQIGRTIGFPTANIQISDPYKIIPARGVYLVWVTLTHQKYLGLMNIGIRPTLSGEHLSIEVHILDFSADIYGQTLQVQFIDFIREEKKFNSLEALQKQILQDKQQALEHPVFLGNLK